MGRRKTITVALDLGERSALEAVVRSGVSEMRVVRRARALLMWADGATAREIQAAGGPCETMARRWVKRYLAEGIAGLKDRKGRGQKRVFPPARGRLHRQARVRTA